ncbi:hypothetical protein HY628_01470 [Candidatus Uhrbacteria bacterium]|nr:hypothetical protein [Candidatus Uhrbacteria bacterium]
MNQNRKVEQRSYEFGKFGGIGSELPWLTRARLIAASLDGKQFTLAFDHEPLKAADKATSYSAMKLAGKQMRYLAAIGQIALIEGDLGIAVEPNLAAMVDQMRVILSQSNGRTKMKAEDVIFALVEGKTEIIVRTANGAIISLSDDGFTRVAWNNQLCGFIGVRGNNPNLYYLSLDEAVEGHWAARYWVVSNQHFMTGNVLGIPYRISGSNNLEAVPVRTTGGMELVDLTHIAEGKIKFLTSGKAPTMAVEVLGSTDENGSAVFVAGDRVKNLVLVPGKSLAEVVNLDQPMA